MPYITTVERIGIRKGALLENRDLIVETLNERFGEVPSSISEAIVQIEDRRQLRTLYRQAIWSTSVEEFQQQLNGLEIAEVHRNISDDERLWQEIKQLEEEINKPYITSLERIGIRKGAVKENQELVIETLYERFGDIPTYIPDGVLQIQDHGKLRSLHRHAIRSASINEFRQQLDRH